MKILFTGASSFTGLWFVRELSRAGHQVVATFRREPRDYPDALRRERVRLAAEACRPVFGVSFGDEGFLRLAGEGFDLLAHHAADVTHYKSPDFDVCAALAANTRNLGPVLQALHGGGCRRVLLTGSVFEGGEGAGSQGLPDFSPYGLSKALTAQVLRFACARAGMGLGKLVIPNPFGPWEEPRFTTYLARTWLDGGVASVKTPDYVRDNIHVRALADAYVRFVESDAALASPSQYRETQGAFAQRFARELEPRLGVPCRLELREQVDFSEPLELVNTDPVDGPEPWDELAEWYLR